MTFIERETGESLAMHLHRNAEALGADVRQRRILREAAAMSFPQRSARDRADAGRMAETMRNELKAALAEVTYAAQARGETVEPFNDAGAVRLKGRDGLLTLSKAGTLTTGEVEVGLVCRQLAEHADNAGVGSQLSGLGDLKGSAKPDARIIMGLRQAYSGVRMTDVYRHVQAADPSGLALRMLKGVAIEGRAVSSLVSGGRPRANAAAALRTALRIAASRLAETGGLRIRGS